MKEPSNSTSVHLSPTDPGLSFRPQDAAHEDIKNLAEKILREWIKSRELFRIGDLHAELAIRGYAFESTMAVLSAICH